MSKNTKIQKVKKIVGKIGLYLGKKLVKIGIFLGKIIFLLGLLLFLLSIPVHLALQYSPTVRAFTLQKVSQALKKPVNVGELAFSWRTMRPSIQLRDIRILSGTPQNTPYLTFPKVTVSFSWQALLQGELNISELSVPDLVLKAERNTKGEILFQGLGKQGETNWQNVLTNLEKAVGHIEKISLENAKFTWQDAILPVTNTKFEQIEATLSRQRERFWLEIDAPFAAKTQWAKNLHIEGELNGILSMPNRLIGELSLEVEDLSVQYWQKLWLKPELRLQTAPWQLSTTLYLNQGKYRAEAMLHGEAARIFPKNAAVFLQNQPHFKNIDFKKFNIGLYWQPQNAKLGVLRLAPDIVSQNKKWDAQVWQIGYQLADEKNRAQYQISVPFVFIPDVVNVVDAIHWKQNAPNALKNGLNVMALEGAVRDFQANILPKTDKLPLDYQAKARIMQFAVAAGAHRPGAAGLDLDLQFQPKGGQGMVTAARGALRAPMFFADPMPLLDLKMPVNWQYGDNKTFKVRAENWSFHDGRGVEGGGLLELNFDGQPDAPGLIVDARGAASILPNALAYVPHSWPKPLQEWLKTAIRAGSARDLRIQMDGRVPNLPFDVLEKPGKMRIEAHLENLNLKFAPEWPLVENLSGNFELSGAGLRIETVDAARMNDLPIQELTAHIFPLKDPQMTLDGMASSDLRNFANLVLNTPLKKDYASILEQVKIEGNAELNLNLQMALSKPNEVKHKAKLTLMNDTLVLKEWPQPFKSVEGVVYSDANGMRANGITGRVLGLPITVNLSPERQNNQMTTRIDAHANIDLPKNLDDLSPILPKQWLRYAEGISHWEVRTNLSNQGGELPVIHLQSDLVGTEINLPPPMNKARQIRGLTDIWLHPSKARGMDINMTYDDFVKARMQVQNSQVVAGYVRLGGEDAPMPSLGWHIHGDTPLIDWDSWQKVLFDDNNTANTNSNNNTKPAELTTMGLRGEKLLALGQVFEKPNLKLVRKENNYRLNAESPDAKGYLEWQGGTSRPFFYANFDYIKLVMPENKKNNNNNLENQEDEPLNPSGWPSVEFRTKQFILSKENLGQAKISMQAIPHGVKFLEVSLLNGTHQLKTSGQWTRQNGISQASMNGLLRTPEIGQLLRAMNIKTRVEAQNTDVLWDFNWSERAKGIDWQVLNGQLDFQLNKGSMLDVDPGAARLLGLFNIFALPRRLQFEFNDVVNQGLYFDVMRGGYDLRKGVAYTRANSTIDLDSASVRLKAQGFTDLNQSTHDYRVKVRSTGISGGTAIVAGVAVNPVIGGAFLLLQKLFGDPIDKLLGQNYHIYGNWDSPTIEKGK